MVVLLAVLLSLRANVPTPVKLMVFAPIVLPTLVQEAVFSVLEEILIPPVKLLLTFANRIVPPPPRVKASGAAPWFTIVLLKMIVLAAKAHSSPPLAVIVPVVAVPPVAFTVRVLPPDWLNPPESRIRLKVVNSRF